MIVFDIRCDKDHVFESWFASGAAFETLRAAGEVVCPVCGSTDVAKAPMAPNVATLKTPRTADAGSDEAKPVAKPDPRRQAAADAYLMLARMRDYVEKNSDYVGDKFPEEARKVHYGEVERRNIHGEATPDEAEDLREEGIEFARIPWVDRVDN